jgi:threonine/homoserine/homoserine lactone efflux protein
VTLAIGALLRNLIADISSATVALRLVAGAYLAIIAIKLWRARPRERQRLVSVRRVFVTTLLNPKALVFALVIIPFRVPTAPLYFLGFLSMVVSIGTAWIIAGRLLARSTSGRYSASVPRATALVLTIFSAALIVSALVG